MSQSSFPSAVYKLFWPDGSSTEHRFDARPNYSEETIRKGIFRLDSSNKPTINPEKVKRIK